MTRFRLFAAPIAAFASLLPARADVTIVSQTTMEGLPPQAPARARQGTTTKTFYKEGKIRMEVGDAVSITEGSRVFLIRTGAKTYSVTTLSKLGETTNPMLAMIQLKMNADVRPGGRTRLILGKPATNYLFAMTMKIGLKPDATPGGTDGKKTEIPEMLTVVIQGEQWVTEAVALPQMPNAASSMGMMRGLAIMAGAKEMTEKFAQIKGLPLRMTMTQTFQGGAGFPGLPDKPITTKMQVTSIHEGTLPASLFVVPKGYKQVPFTGVDPTR